jgi:hypothetical protein
LSAAYYVVPGYNGMPEDGFEVMRRLFEGEWSCSDAEAEPTQPVRATIAGRKGDTATCSPWRLTGRRGSRYLKRTLADSAAEVTGAGIPWLAMT